MLPAHVMATFQAGYLTEGYVSRMVNPTTIAPDIVAAILVGKLPPE